MTLHSVFCKINFLPCNVTDYFSMSFTSPGCANPGRLIALTTKFCALGHNIFGVVIAVLIHSFKKHVCQFTCIEQKAPNESEFYRALQYGIPCHTFWHQEFRVAPRFVERCVHPCTLPFIISPSSFVTLAKASSKESKLI